MTKIKIICSKAKFINSKFVVSITNGVITPTDGNNLTSLDTQEITVTETLKSADAGNYVLQVADIRLIRPSTYLNQLMRSGFILQFTTNAGAIITMGSIDKPAYIKSGSANIDITKLRFERETLNFEFINEGDAVYIDPALVPYEEGGGGSV
jgi:hypothetical protein